MPRLLVFVPAEKVLIDSEDNTIGLVGILGGLNVPAPEPLPEDAGAPVRWNVLALWKRQPEDEGRQYEQRVQLVSPSGRVLVEGLQTFQMVTSSQRNRLRIDGFPVAEEGEHTLALSLRDAGEETWRDIADYPLAVSHFDPKAVTDG